MSKRRLCLSSLILLLVVTLFLAVMPFMGRLSVDAEEVAIKYSDDLLVDFSQDELDLSEIVYDSTGVEIVDGKLVASESTGYVVFAFEAPIGQVISNLDVDFSIGLDYLEEEKDFAIDFNVMVGSDLAQLVSVYDFDAEIDLVDAEEDKEDIVREALMMGIQKSINLEKYAVKTNEFFVKLLFTNSGDGDVVTLSDIEFDITTSFPNTKVVYILFDQYGTTVQFEQNVQIGDYVSYDASNIDSFELLSDNIYRDIEFGDNQWEPTEIVPSTEYIVPGAEYYIQGIWHRYSITYELNGGVNNAGNQATYVTSQGMKLESAGRSGYKFGGWYLSCVQNAETGALEFSDPIYSILRGQKGDLVLYARWVEDIPMEKDVPPVEKPDAGCASSMGADTLVASSVVLAIAGLFLSIRFIKRKSN